ncbi:MAG: 3-hydroxyacyl-CoA dehydrogenase NAD-binding domain-containing protein, partial [Nitrospinota bacterium]
MTEIRRIAVIGGGYVGRGLAVQFAHGGYEVSLYNRTEGSSSRAMDGIEFYLRAFVENR